MGRTALLPLRRKCALRIFITHKNPTSSAGPEPAAANTIGNMASTLTISELHKLPNKKSAYRPTECNNISVINLRYKDAISMILNELKYSHNLYNSSYWLSRMNDVLCRMTTEIAVAHLKYYSRNRFRKTEKRDENCWSMLAFTKLCK
jgi:hypothetical protein